MSIQRISYCTQCECPLPKKCSSCVKHPDRKPRIVEIFDAPPVLSINSCGCVQIQCQRAGCHARVWRHPRADGTLGNKNHFCSPACVRLVTAQAKVAQRVTAPCSCGCGRTVTRSNSLMRAKRVYFSQVCHFRHRVALKAAARRVKEADVQAFQCASPRCRGEITDHTRLASGLYDCVRCHARAKEPAMGYERHMAKIS